MTYKRISFVEREGGAPITVVLRNSVVSQTRLGSFLKGEEVDSEDQPEEPRTFRIIDTLAIKADTALRWNLHYATLEPEAPTSQEYSEDETEFKA